MPSSCWKRPLGWPKSRSRKKIWGSRSLTSPLSRKSDGRLALARAAVVAQRPELGEILAQLVLLDSETLLVEVAQLLLGFPEAAIRRYADEQLSLKEAKKK